MPEPVDVREIMQQIHEQVRKRAAWREPGASLERPLPEAEELERALRLLRIRKDLVGDLPPSPPTLRGRLGALLVKAVRRAISWYTPQLRDFHTGILDACDVQAAAVRALAAALDEQRKISEDLRNRVQVLSERLADLERLPVVSGTETGPDGRAGAR